MLFTTKAAFVFYLFVILTEVATRYGLEHAELKGKTTLLPLADICGLLSLSFLIYYSYQTVWYAFILLLAVYMVIFITMRRLLTAVVTNKKKFQAFSGSARFLLLPLIILMFLLVNK